jgi:hypothetical protein
MNLFPKLLVACIIPGNDEPTSLYVICGVKEQARPSHQHGYQKELNYNHLWYK